MSVFRTLLTIGSLAAEVAAASSLEEMRRLGQGDAVMQALVSQLKNDIFEYNRAARDLLNTSTESKIIASAMRVLHLRLERSGIKPEYFPELRDKEYALETIRLIRDSKERLYADLSSQDREKAEAVATHTLELPEYQTYIEGYPKLVEYKLALPLAKGNPGTTRAMSVLAIFCGATFIFMVLCLYSFLGEIGNIFIPVALVGLAAIAWGIYSISTTGKNVKAKAQVEKIKSETDITKLLGLDVKFGGDVQRVKALKEQAELDISQFFGDPDDGNTRLLAA